LVLSLALAGLVSHAVLPGMGMVQAQPPAPTALPTGLNVVQGQAAVQLQGSQMTVNNSAGAVLNWQSFNIGAASGVRFEQPSAASTVLNRVVGNDPSKIFGSLSSNGEVWLVNPYGVLFGRDARVDVGSLVVSTLNIGNDDWRAGRMSLSAGLGAPADASVVNQGELRSTLGGRILLLAGAGGVRNEGLITAPDGQVALAAGQSIDLVDEKLGNLAVRVQAPAGQALNLGSLSAGGGRVDLLAAMVNQQGIVRADGIGPNSAAGEVRLAGSQSVTLEAGSLTTASGAVGGKVLLDAGQDTMLSGTVQALGSQQGGGTVKLLGERVGLLQGSSVDVSGQAGGGQIYVGGGLQGRDASIRNAQALYMDPEASLRADAVAAGDGGSIFLWSNTATRAYGSLSARGGASGGNGGFIETSGGWLDAQPKSIRTDAPAGLAGMWLLDPPNIFIVSGGSNLGITPGPNFLATADNALITTQTLSTALNGGNNVSVTTAGGNSTQPGDIAMLGATLSVNPSVPVSLTFNATRNIRLLDSSIISTGLPLTVNLNAATGGQGSIRIDSSVINTSNGNVLLGGLGTVGGGEGGNLAPFQGAKGFDGQGVGVLVTASQLLAGTGSIQINGLSEALSGKAQGVAIKEGSQLRGRDITLRGWVASFVQDERTGVAIDSGTVITATDSISLSGTVTAFSGATSEAPVTGTRIAGKVEIPVLGGTSIAITGDIFLESGASSFAYGVVMPSTGSIDANGASTLDVSSNASMRLGDFSGTGSAQIIASRGGETKFFSSDTESGAISWNNVEITGSPSKLSMTAATIEGRQTVNLAGSANYEVTADNFTLWFGSSINVPGYVTLSADFIRLEQFTTISSDATGVAIYIGGKSFGSPTQSFVNNAGSGVFNVDGGYWWLFATESEDTNVFNLGDLYYDGTHYDPQALLSGQENKGPFSEAAQPNSNQSLSGPDGNLLLLALTPTLSQGEGQPPISRTYNAGTFVDIPDGAVSGLIRGDRISGQFDDPNVGIGKSINISSDVFDTLGRPVYGYQNSGNFSLSGEVTPVVLELTGLSVQTRAYDGTMDATLQGGSLSGFIGIETLNFIADNGLFDTKDAGQNKGASGTVTLTEGSNGGLVGNYSLAGGSQRLLTGTITPKLVSLSSFTALGKVYDGESRADITGGALAGLVGDEFLQLSFDATFDTRNVGSNKPFSGTAFLMDGFGSEEEARNSPNSRPRGPSPNETILVGTPGLASNYQLDASGQFTNVSSTASITVAEVSLNLGLQGLATPADPKAYDGNTSATFSAAFVEGLTGLDGVTFDLSANFASKNVQAGSGVQVVTGFFTLLDGSEGGLASNYTIVGPDFFLTTGLILPTVVTATNVTAANRVYNGTTSASFLSGDIQGLVAGELLSVSLAGAQFANKNVGNSIAVSGTISLANGPGGLASNYQLSSNSISTAADITRRPVSITGVQVTEKAYDGTRAATLSGGTVTGAVAGEQLGLSTANGLFDTKDVGSGKPVSGTAVLSNGSDGELASNYLLQGAGTFAASGNIQPRTVSLVFAGEGQAQADAKVYDGTRTATFTGTTLSGLLGSETLSLSLNALFSRKDVFAPGTQVGSLQAVDGSATLGNGTNGGLASNYSLSGGGSFSRQGSISPRSVSVQGAVAQSRAYDGTRNANLIGGGISGLVVNESLSLSYSNALFDTKDAGNGKSASASANLQDGANGRASNYLLSSSSVQASGDVLRKPVSVVGINVQNRVYDGTRDAVISGGTLQGLVGLETLGLSTANAQFSNKDAGQGKLVSGDATLSNGSNGGLASNYELQSGSSFFASGDIQPRPLTLVLGGNGLADAKIYDGTRTATFSGAQLSGLLGSESLTLSFNALFSSKNVFPQGQQSGSLQAVTGTATLSNGANGGLASNYSLTGGGTVQGQGSITARTVAVQGATAQTRSYDGTRMASLSGGSVSNLAAGESLALNYADGLFQTKDVGVGKPVTGTVALADSGSGIASNYVLSSSSVAATGDIQPKALTLSGVTALNKVYDGVRDASISGGSLSGLVGAETLGLTSTDAQFNTKDAGQGKGVSGTVSLNDGSNGGLLGNYSLASNSFFATADIEARPLTLVLGSNGLADAKIYDGTRTATFSGAQLSGLLGSELLTLSIDALFASKNVFPQGQQSGSLQAVTGTATLSNGANGGLVSNYSLTGGGTVQGQGSITARTVAVQGATAQTRSYDGTRTASLSGGSVSNLVAGESLALNYASGLFQTKDAGQSKPATGTVVLADSGTSIASNYVLSSSSVAATGDIQPKTVVINGVTVADKVYDGLLGASISGGTLSGTVGSETLVLSSLTASFDTKDVGANKAVNVNAVLADGSNGGLAANYLLDAGNLVSSRASIVAREISLSNVLAASRSYDGTRDATLFGGALSNLVVGEALGVSLSAGTFDTKDAGIGKTVVGTASLQNGAGGGLATNYRLTTGVVSTIASITPKELSVLGLTAASRSYDGTRTASLSGGSLSGLIGNETLSFSAINGQFDTKDAGVGKSATGLGLLADGQGGQGGQGADGGLARNYSLAGGGAVLARGTIAPRAVSVAGVTASSRAYDGSRDASLGAGTVNNLVGDERLTLAFSGATFDTKDTGVNKPVSGSVALRDGTAGGLATNYALGLSDVSARADITPRTLQVIGVTAASKVYDANTAALLGGGSLSGLVGNETLSLSLSNGNFDNKNAGQNKLVVGLATVGNGQGGGLASNYALAAAGSVSTRADIDARSVTLSGVTAASKPYDGTTVASASGGILSGLLGNEALTLSYSANFADRNASNGLPVSVTGAALAADGANGGLAANYRLSNGGAFSTSAVIDRRAIGLGPVTAANKVYDGTTAVVLSGGALTGLVPTESLIVTLNGALSDRNAGLLRPVTGSAQLADGTGKISNYLLSQPGFSTTADVAQRGVSLASAAVANKVYDGTTLATVTSWALSGVLPGDQVVVATGAGAFINPNVGEQRQAAVNATQLGGANAGNYRLGAASASASAAITPATLVYDAAQLVSFVGSSLLPLTGTVTGLMAGETLATAAIGQAVFTSLADVSSLPGSYRVTGAGLTAPNYRFVQAVGNAFALTLIERPTELQSNEIAFEPPDRLRTASILSLRGQGDRFDGRVVDATPALQQGDGDQGPRFGAIDISGIGQEALAAVLEARNRYKRSVLAEARARLETNPDLADLPACDRPDQIDSGTCLLTDEQLAQGPTGAGPSTGPGGLPLPPAVALAPGLAAAPAGPPSGQLLFPPPTPPVGAPGAVSPIPPVLPTPLPVPLPSPLPSPLPAPGALPPPPSLPPGPRPTPPVGVGAAAVAASPALAAATAAAVRPVKPAPTMRAPPLPVARPVTAAALPQIQRKIAVLISADNYADARIPQLENANRDAEAVASVLETRLGYDTVIIRDASREALVGTLNKLAAEARPTDSVVIFYAGHGEVVEKTNAGYWIPANADATRPETWVSNSDINKMIGRIKAFQVLLISDSCFSGSLVGDRRVSVPGEQPQDARTILGRRAAVVMSSGGNEPVADGGRDGHSPFASSLMRNLGTVSNWRVGNSVFEQVRDEVAQRTPQVPQYGTASGGRHSQGADYLWELRALGGSARAP